MNVSHDLVALTYKINTIGSHALYHYGLYGYRIDPLVYPGLGVRGVTPVAAADWLD